VTAGSGALLGAAALLDRSIGYLLGNLALVTPRMLDRATPCPGWRLADLLDHVEDGLDALAEAASGGTVAGSRTSTSVDRIMGVRSAARRVLAGWSAPGLRADVTIDGMRLSTAIVAAAGSIEVAAHGWDIARAAGWRRPIPASLAEEMLDLVPILLPDASSGCRYAAAVPVPEQSCPGDRLIAALGRRPPDPVERRYLQSRAALLLSTSRSG